MSTEETAPALLATVEPELRRVGFAFVAGTTMAAHLAECGPLDDWADFAASWNDLAVDTYMADQGRYRRRRHCVYAADGDRLQRAPAQPHYQALEYNTLNGGIARWFEPIASCWDTGSSLPTILRYCQRLFGALAPDVAGWQVEVHQFRIEARAGEAGLPTPEGVHRDGVDYEMCIRDRRKPGPVRRFFGAIWDAINFTRRLVFNLIFLFVLLIFVIALSAKAPVIEPRTALVLELKGELVEQYRTDEMCIRDRYTSDAAVISLAAQLLILAGLFQFSDGIQVASNGALRGLKDTRVPMLITVLAYWGIGMPVGWYLTFPLDMGARGMWIGLIAGLSAAAVLLFLRFNRQAARGRWQQAARPAGVSLADTGHNMPH